MPRVKITTKEKRLEYILSLYAMGYMEFQMVELCMKEWKIKERMARRYLEWVKIFLKQELDKTDKDKFITEYNALIIKYEKLGDAKQAFLYRQHRDKILGLTIERRDITSGGQPLQQIIKVIVADDEEEKK